MKNKEIKKLLRVNSVPQWKLAKALNVCELTVQRMLRGDEEELPQEKQEQILSIINALSV